MEQTLKNQRFFVPSTTKKFAYVHNGGGSWMWEKNMKKVLKFHKA